jgi:hypothetical protein
VGAHGQAPALATVGAQDGTVAQRPRSTCSATPSWNCVATGELTPRTVGTRRLDTVESEPLPEVGVLLDHFRRFRGQRLDAPRTELTRERRSREANSTENRADEDGKPQGLPWECGWTYRD